LSELVPIAGAGLLIVAVVAVAWWLGRGRHRAPSASRPSWRGVDHVQLEADVKARMDELRRARRLEPLRMDESLSEIAHCRAVDEAAGARPVGQTDEELGLEGLRRRLCPELLGPLHESRAGADGRRGEQELCTTGITEALERSGAWFDPRWTACGVGSAAGQGRIEFHAVFARRLAILDGAEWPHGDDGLPVEYAPRLDLNGVLAEGLDEGARLQLHRPSGVVEEVRPEVRGRRFAVHVRADEQGVHTLLADDDVFFCWRFEDSEQK